MRIVVLIVTALLAGALVAGCGGEDQQDKKDQFARDFKPVNEQILLLGGQVREALTQAGTTPDRVLGRVFRGFETQVQEAKAALDELEPPDDLRDEQRALSTALGKLVADLRGIHTAIAAKDPAATRRATAALIRDSEPAGNARRDLAEKTGARVAP
jgi:outer membrane murein-binding lipoprotein Lpp